MRAVSGQAPRRPLRAAAGRPAAPGAQPPAAGDWLLVAVAVTLAITEAALRPDIPWPAASAAASTLSLAVLPWRRVHPLAVLTWAVAAGSTLEIVQIAQGVVPVGLYSGVVGILAPYALFRWGSGRAILVGAPVVTAGVAVSVLAGGGRFDDAVGGLTLLVLVALFGEVVRQRVAARARELERVRAQERELIARDLHDTVAHHLSAVAVRAQAGQISAAAGSGDPAAAVEALRMVEDEARLALTEMRSLVGMLRNERPPDPVPGIERLRTLVDPGPPPVTVHIADDAAPLPAATSTALFRIAQESVANARRHARDATRIAVELARREGGVVLTVHDDGAAVPQLRRAPGHGPPPDTGYGLTGMRERARALGGSLQAGPDGDHGWMVRANLPAGPSERGGGAGQDHRTYRDSTAGQKRDARRGSDPRESHDPRQDHDARQRRDTRRGHNTLPGRDPREGGDDSGAWLDPRPGHGQTEAR
ncbi:sensor histidine kinase [Myceligenerans crystallogenes]|uniref:histidine kinase n=1 Tax=Myceligenerans crystallogenes TaxID=316335 RepID=A0ABP4ZWK4_9MICO